MADTTIISKITNIYNYCIHHCAENERWPSYYKRRYLEFLSYLDLFPEKHYGKVLELGCGIGYQSAFLSKICDEVIATDLADEDVATHAPGMKSAELLHKQLDISNIKLLTCSAEALPFPDQTFDMVYSSHVLEHIPDQQKALKEIYRVLKPGGIHFCVVPTSTEKVYAFFNFYSYLTGRTIHHLLAKFAKKRTLKSKQVSGEQAHSIKNAAAAQLKYFPFPAPHGHYPHYLSELKAWRPALWASKITTAAPFKIIHQSTTQINPLLSILGAVLPTWGTAVHSLTRKTERRIGGLPFFKSLGINTVIICLREMSVNK